MTDPLLTNDIEALLRSYLLQQPDIVALVKTGDTVRIWAGSDPPEGFAPTPVAGKPRTGPGILITILNGELNQTGVIARPLVRFWSYGRNQAEARALNTKLYAVLEDRGFRTIRRIFIDGVATIHTDAKGWDYAEAMYRVVALMR